MTDQILPADPRLPNLDPEQRTGPPPPDDGAWEDPELQDPTMNAPPWTGKLFRRLDEINRTVTDHISSSVEARRESNELSRMVRELCDPETGLRITLERHATRVAEYYQSNETAHAAMTQRMDGHDSQLNTMRAAIRELQEQAAALLKRIDALEGLPHESAIVTA